MKKNSFRLSFSAFVLLLGLLSTSCSKDDDTSVIAPSGTNTEYNNKKYAIKNGFIHDGGAVDHYLDDEAESKTHYNYSFILTDGTPTFEGDDVVSMNDGSIVVSAILLSPGTTTFNTGTFEFADYTGDEELDEEELEAKYRNKYFFPLAFVITDSDGDKNWEEEAGELVTGGTFKVSGTAPNYTTEYNLTLDGGKTIKGKFTGKFNVVQ